MKIIFKKVHLHHFMSFDDAEIDLDNNGYVLVSGVNQNEADNAVSNGAGKSSIFEAISYCLTGNTIRGFKEIANNYFNDGCYVELWFNIDTDEYHLLRSKDDKQYKTNLRIFINGEDKSGKGISDTTKLLAQYLPDITSSLLGSVIILGQGLPQRFTNNTPAGRKDVLEKLSKSDFMIEDLKNRVALRKNQLYNDLRKCEDEVLRKQTEKQVNENRIKTAESSLAAMGSTDSLKEQLQIYTDTGTEKQAQLVDIQTKLSEINEENEKITQQLNESYQKYNTAILEINKYQSSDEFVSIQNNINELTGKASALRTQISRCKSVKDICPTCGQKLPDVHKIDTTDMETELQQITEDINKFKETQLRIKQSHDAELDAATHQYNAEQSSIKIQGNQVSTEYRNAKAFETQLTNDLATLRRSYDMVQRQIHEYDIKKQGFENDILSSRAAIESAEQEILYNNNERDTLKQHIDVITKFETVLKRDFRGYLLENVINYIDAKAKEYCYTVFNNDKIKFELNGNYINISFCGKSYESLSGGEKQKIDLIIQFALRDMLCNYLNFSSNIIAFDEIFDNMDSVGCERTMDLIAKNLPDLSSIYIITHHSDIAIPADVYLNIVKDKNGISSVS